MNRNRNRDSAQTTIRGLISWSEELLATLGEEGSQRYHDAALGLKRQVRRARDQVDDLQYGTVRRARLAARQADRYVRENPWTTAGAAAVIGAAVGTLVALLLVHRGESDGDDPR